MSQRTLTVEQVKAITRKQRTRRKPSRCATARERFMQVLPKLSSETAEQQRTLFELHDQAEWTIRFPLAPSVNNYRVVVRNRLMTTSEGQEYHDAIKRLWLAHWDGRPPEPLTGRLRLLITVVFGTSPPPDLDNRIKPLQDALAYAGAFENDNQIDDVRVIRSPVVQKPGWMDVTIETISEGVLC